MGANAHLELIGLFQQRNRSILVTTSSGGRRMRIQLQAFSFLHLAELVSESQGARIELSADVRDEQFNR